MRDSEDFGYESVGKRVKLIRLADGLEARISSPKSVFGLIFLSIWLIAWTVGGVTALWSLLSGRLADSWFLVIWLCFWAVAEVFATYVFLWQAIGYERITIRRGHLEMGKIVFRPRWVKSVPIDQIQGIRAAGQFDTIFSVNASLRHYGITGGNIALEASGVTYRFGIGLDENDSIALAKVCREEISKWL